MNSISFGATSNAWLMRWTASASCGGTHAPTTHHLIDPNISKKLSTFGPNLKIPSTYHPKYPPHPTARPPWCPLSAYVAQMYYPSTWRAWIPSVSFVSYRTPMSTSPCRSALSAASNPPALLDLIFSVASLIFTEHWPPVNTNMWLCLERG